MLAVDVNQQNEAVAYTVSCVVAVVTVAMANVLFMTSPLCITRGTFQIVGLVRWKMSNTHSEMAVRAYCGQYRVSQKSEPQMLYTTSSNIGQFSEFIHC